MKQINRVRRFWDAHVNNEYYTREARGSDAYFADIRRKRYAHHYHIPPLLENITRQGRCCEIGCGIGIDSIELARKGVPITGVDMSFAALRVAQGYANRNRLDVSFVQANAEHLPFKDKTFATVYSFGVLHHTPDMAAGVEQARRVLMDGGKATVMLYARFSLVNLVHTLLGLPFESPVDRSDHCPVVYRVNRPDIRRLFSRYARVRMQKAYPFTYGFRWVTQMIPLPVKKGLGRLFGWHWIIEATVEPGKEVR